MKINEGQIYVISNKYFDDFKDEHFSLNKNGRPSLIAIKDSKRDDVYWAVPRTRGSFEKYKIKYEKEINKRGFCDKFHIYNGNVYMIQSLFPVSEDYISNAFTICGDEVKILGKNKKQIETKVKKTIAMAFNGVKPCVGIARTDIKRLYEELISKLDSKEC